MHFGRLTSLAALCAGACVGPAIEQAWDLRTHEGLLLWTGTENLSLPCTAAPMVRLDLRTACRAGSLRVCLRDPNGRVRHDARFDSGSYAGTLSWPTGAGVWTCEVRGEGFSGDYRVELRASTAKS